MNSNTFFGENALQNKVVVKADATQFGMNSRVLENTYEDMGGYADIMNVAASAKAKKPSAKAPKAKADATVGASEFDEDGFVSENVEDGFVSENVEDGFVSENVEDGVKDPNELPTTDDENAETETKAETFFDYVVITTGQKLAEHIFDHYFLEPDCYNSSAIKEFDDHIGEWSDTIVKQSLVSLSPVTINKNCKEYVADIASTSLASFIFQNNFLDNQAVSAPRNKYLDLNFNKRL
jgi:hypothetical protein